MAFTRQFVHSRSAQAEQTGPLTIAPKIITGGWSLVSIALIFTMLRFYAKHKSKSAAWWDDIFVVLAWLCLFAAVICTTMATTLGFGQKLQDIPFENLPQVTLYTNVLSISFSIIASAWSKTAMALSLRRISRNMKFILWFTSFSIVTVQIAAGSTILFSFIRCNPVSKSWDWTVEGECWPNEIVINYGIAISVLCGVLDLILAALPWNILWNLQIKTDEKIGIALTMSMGTLAAMAALIRSYYLSQALTRDFSFQGFDVMFWGAFESCIMIVAVSLPVLRVLLRNMKTSFQSKKSNRGKTVEIEFNHLAGPKQEVKRSNASDLSDDIYPSRSSPVPLITVESATSHTHLSVVTNPMINDEESNVAISRVEFTREKEEEYFRSRGF